MRKQLSWACLLSLLMLTLPAATPHGANKESEIQVQGIVPGSPAKPQVEATKPQLRFTPPQPVRPTPLPEAQPTQPPPPPPPYEVLALRRLIDLHEMGMRVAQLAETRTGNRDLRRFATRFAAHELKEQRLAEDLLVRRFGLRYEPRPFPNFLDTLDELKARRGLEFDAEFTETMLGLETQEYWLARQVRRRVPHGELNRLAEDIVDVNENEIDDLESWLEDIEEEIEDHR